MSERGSAFLLKIAEGGEDASYKTLAGLKVEAMTISGEPVPTKPKNGWRELLDGVGVRSVTVGASGIFVGSEAEAQVKRNALDGTLGIYELSFESGERMRARFLITRLEYAGDFNGERNYRIGLESSGEVRSL